ncbi:M14 family metallopeptidase [Vibrio metschnikovii]|uniref:M14 family metallopeptidase n=1 Tax=Vibrio metschnikovii TaxID=28172 RepID=UPI001C307079|nr:M14 family metallocarboxypeptidase [Vibrio metschnikovii]
MTTAYRYPIGTRGQPWTEQERQAWRAQTKIQRPYQAVVEAINALSEQFCVEQYGALSYDPERYPLLCVKTQPWHADKPTLLVTGGVHGYETSGVFGALQFLTEQAYRYAEQMNIVVVPCVSPWGYETIQRWNPNALDPNRCFYPNSPAEESASLMALVDKLPAILAHIDLHETTDSDENEFRPALAARDGVDYQPGHIPDGFYTVGDSENPQLDFQAAIIESVRQVTHIAPADQQGQIIGSPVIQEGVIVYPVKELGLCASVTNSQYCSTTEVYPDSPRVNSDDCNAAQVAAIVGALNYLYPKTTYTQTT